MLDRFSIDAVQRLWRYYQAGIVNALFGYSLYAIFVRAGLNMYVAQITAHVLGVVFNYFTYSRYAFRGTQARKARFVLSYAVNYLLGLGSLAAASQVIASPYVAGFVSLIFVSVLNYFILRHLVFSRSQTS
jgi:putative flippase GtrA